MVNIVTVAPSGSGKSRIANYVRGVLMDLAKDDRACLGDAFTPVFTVGTVPGIVQLLVKNKGMAVLMPDEYFGGFGAQQLAPSTSVDRQRMTAILSGNAAHVGAFTTKEDECSKSTGVCSASTTQPVAYQQNAASSEACVEDGFLQRLFFLPCVAMEPKADAISDDDDDIARIGTGLVSSEAVGVAGLK